MESLVNKRITEIIENEGVTLTKFAQLIRVAQTSLRDVCKKDAEPKYSTLSKILIAKPSISAEWLMRGTGSMYLNESSSSQDEEFYKTIIRDYQRMVDGLNERIAELEGKINTNQKTA